MASLSLCMIVKDEEKSLPECLESVQGLVDEIVIVDTGSKDRTPEIAKEFGAKVFPFSWINDFAAARNESLRHATGDYILWLDADDRIPPEERDKFSLWKERLPEARDRAYWFVIESPEQGDDFFSRYALQVRAFPNRPGVGFIRRIHESVIDSLMLQRIALEETSIRITHRGYSDPASVQRKAMRNLKMLLGALAENPRDFVTLWHLSQTYGVLGNYEKALHYAKRFLEEGCFEGQPDWRIAALINVARCYSHLGEDQEAEGYLKQAELEASDNPMVLYFLSDHYLRKGALEEAKSRLLKLTALQPRPSTVPFPLKVAKWRAHLILATILRAEGRLKEALGHSLEAFRMNPEGSPKEVYLVLGELALKGGEEGLAFWLLERAERKDQGALDLKLLLCLLCARRGDVEGVLLRLEAILKALGLSLEGDIEDLKELGEIFGQLAEFLEAKGLEGEARLAQGVKGALEALQRRLSPG